jgi:release factor glutamine methyltransferase
MWATVLSSHFGWSSSEILLHANARFSESDLLLIRNVVKRLQKHEPFQYIIGTVYFADLNLKIDRRALIPRPETEELIDLLTKQGQTFAHILDLCTGSGCIALALKKKFPDAVVKGLDLSSDAISLAKENAAQLKLDVAFKNSDIFDSEVLGSFDLIVSNPPYIPFEDQHQMQANVLDYEPHLALFVPDHDPLLFYKQIIKIAQNSLLSSGFLALEIHENYALQTKALFEGKGYQTVQIYTDLQGKQRMILAQKS